MGRSSRGVLWIVLSLSLSIAVGTTLLSNDMDHLRKLIGHFEHQFASEQARTSRLPVRPSGLPPASPTPELSIPRRLIEAPKFELAGQFLRIWRVTGPNMCKALREAGIEMTEWRAPSMRSTSHECYFQRIYTQDEARPLSSIFLKIRGNARGDILEVRGKINGPSTDGEGRLDPALMRIFETLVDQARWSDFQDTLVSVRSLRDVEYERFGAYFSFTRQAAGENSFNFMLVLAATSGPQTRTRAYFSSDRWVAAPDPLISGDLVPIFQRAQKREAASGKTSRL
ncbi:hypothetical protein ASC97_11360 [Rhizobium sp. Root1203]|nr:hypothetical protein ASC97_11360 [Rhizobium sp. Root1203]